MSLPAPLRPLTRTVTYTRWLHLFISTVIVGGFVFVFPDRRLVVVGCSVSLLMVAALVPAMRTAEGLQARLLLTDESHGAYGTYGHGVYGDGGGGPGAYGHGGGESGAYGEGGGESGAYGEGGGESGAYGEGGGGPGAYGHDPARPVGGRRRPVGDSGISTAPSASWRDRRRTALWLMIRLVLGCAVGASSVQLPMLAFDLVRGTEVSVLRPGGGGPGWLALLAPLPLIALYPVVVLGGNAAAAAARWLLGPSAAERIAALEARTDRLLEHNRLARELHDSIGHALTVAVVQAGAARAAGSAEFTEQALAAIEDSGRHALEDLERVLAVLREDTPHPAARPTLADAERLLSAARGAGAEVSADLGGALGTVPGPVSREGYRIVQEALTNVLRHAGPVPVTVRVAVAGDVLELDVRNPLEEKAAAEARSGGGGSGLRGIRERAALLGGHADTGPYENGPYENGPYGTRPYENGWRVHVRLPLDGLGPLPELPSPGRTPDRALSRPARRRC
ncbi:histidine kinase [Streptomyces varsoviensis]|uniref:sensor histidine kinase n=1 Tax=Streptomyces varsoviensis TaxID=67373 RepID=UPI0033D9ACE7